MPTDEQAPTDSPSALDEGLAAAERVQTESVLTPALAVRRELRPPRRDYNYFADLHARLAGSDDGVGEAGAPTTSVEG